LQALAVQAGERILDVGAGPGFLVAEMTEQVGPNGHVAGVDISDSMVALAQRLALTSRSRAGRPSSRLMRH
jgi:arsenite methyltransferase